MGGYSDEVPFLNPILRNSGELATIAPSSPQNHDKSQQHFAFDVS